MYQPIKPKLIPIFTKRRDDARAILSLPPERRAQVLRAYTNHLPNVENPEGIVFRQESDFSSALDIVSKGQTIIFSCRQAEIFHDLISTHIDELDYKLPFQEVILQFDSPLKVKYPLVRNTGESTHLSAMLLRQVTMTQKEFNESVRYLKESQKHLEVSDSDIELQKVSFNENGEFTQNILCIVFSDGFVFRYAWQSEFAKESFTPDSYAKQSNMAHFEDYRNLAVACIGYINCENVYLQKEGGVHPTVNAKRERNGKSRLEPYYVCRIRGVQYDSQGYEKGVGVKHGIRYDVRGHFRHLTNGKTTWVRPHQRGLQNELYVPKTYLVDKKVSA